MGPKHHAPTGALPPASARVRARAPIGAPTPPPPPAKPVQVPPTRTAHYHDTVTLNHKLTKEVAQLKQDLTKQQQEHDHRTADLLAQIATKTQELEATTTDKNNIHRHYQERKKFWTKQHEDDQKKIDSLTETIKIVVTTRAQAP